jgi:hypothetical protein
MCANPLGGFKPCQRQVLLARAFFREHARPGSRKRDLCTARSYLGCYAAVNDSDVCAACVSVEVISEAARLEGYVVQGDRIAFKGGMPRSRRRRLKRRRPDPASSRAHREPLSTRVPSHKTDWSVN